jgi:hypothetical protein
VNEKWEEIEAKFQRGEPSRLRPEELIEAAKHDPELEVIFGEQPGDAIVRLRKEGNDA